MSKLHLHVTDIDSFVWYQRIESMAKGDMVARLKREAEPNEQMRMGTAFHYIMENPPPDEMEFETITHDGFTFSIECDAEIQLPQVSEIRAQKTYIVNGVNVTLTGKCDGITANKITDYKLTFKPNPETYFDSMQWRAYLDIFNADQFEYIICSARKKGKMVTIYDIATMNMFRYDAMVSDLSASIAPLVDFISDYAPELFRHEKNSRTNQGSIN